MAFRYKDYDNTDRTLIDDRNIWDVIYPIGSIYLTTSETSPNDLFPVPNSSNDYWKWVRLEKGYLYVADGNEIKAGDTGGSKTVTLKTENLPSHNHSISHTHTRGTMDITGSFSSESAKNMEGAFENNGGFHDWAGGLGGWHGNVKFTASRTWTGETSEPSTNFSGTTGSNKPIEVIPPYTAVYCWRRIK